MPPRNVRAAIVGAGSLLGKELADELNGASAVQWDIVLLDGGSASGQLTSAGDEAMIIQPLEASAFAGMDIVFFADEPGITREHWRAAVDAGAGVIDLTGALEKEPDTVVYSPWVKKQGAPERVLGLQTVALISAHPVALMLGLVLTRLMESFASVQAAATVLQPASQQGSAGLDEMHAQTVSLLSFQTVPKEVYDTQVAFNLNAQLGPASKVDLASATQRIRKDLADIAGPAIAGRCALQLLQAPVFSGFTASVFVQLSDQAALADIERALCGGVVTVTGEEDAAPSNQSATEDGGLLVQVREELGRSEGKGFWLWMAADNLRLAARNAVACAAEALALRPHGKPQ